MGFFTGEFSDQGYQPSTLYQWLKPNVSGNQLNGLGETEPRRHTPLHMHNRSAKHPWTKVQEWFYLREARDLASLRDIVAMNLLRKKLDKPEATPIAAHRVEKSPEQWIQLARDFALTKTSVEAFGVTALTEDLLFDSKLGEFDVSDPWIIVMAQRMNYDMMAAAAAPADPRTGFFASKFTKIVRTVYRTYRESFESATDVAAWIRSQGYKAAAYGGTTPGPITYIPAAIRAGLGELGKHGSLINPEIGSGIRLSTVITNMPLVPNTMQKSGIDEFCQSCQLCQAACPGKAISPNKQMIRGVTRWYVDFDKCIPVFAERRACGICLAVCP
jgi:epoxyqueuosine reductase